MTKKYDWAKLLEGVAEYGRGILRLRADGSARVGPREKLVEELT